MQQPAAEDDVVEEEAPEPVLKKPHKHIPQLQFENIDSVSKFNEIESTDQAIRRFMHVFVLFYWSEAEEFGGMVERLNEAHAQYTGLAVDFVHFFGVDMKDERQFGALRQKFALRNKDNKKPLLVYFEPLEKVKLSSKNHSLKPFKSIASTDGYVLEGFIRDRINDTQNKQYGADLESA